MRRARLLAGAWLAGLLLAGCGGSEPEITLRFEAERARWHVDRREREWGEERTREAHRDIAQRFRPTRLPSSQALRDPDVELRYRIAASSALYDADLGADHGATPALADAYRDIAETYPFDEEIRVLARLGQGRMHEQLGEPVEAYRAFAAAVDVPPASFDDGRMEWLRERILDLEAHASRLTRHLPRAERERELAAIDARLRGVARRLDGSRTGWRARRRAAEVLAEGGETRVAVDSLLTLTRDAVSADERADLFLAAGELTQYRLGNASAAESLYVRSAEQGAIVRSAAEASVRLAELRLEQGRHAVARRTADEILSLGARALADRREEANYWRCRILIASGRWEDAVPFLEDGAAGSPNSGFTLACATLLVQRLRSFRSVSEAEALRRLVEVAERVPEAPRIVAPEPWAFSERLDRKAFAWREGIRDLRAAANRVQDAELARRARAAADRIARQRLPTSPARQERP